ncbi:MAG TPA: hypothetical protein VM925_37565, partial [Labilithrix sp.]|nr:hypothetical protein [Labilithrix sp.]
MPSFTRRHRKKLVALAALVVLPVIAHFTVGVATRIPPPDLPTPRFVATATPDGVKRTPHGWTAKRGVHLVYLAGTPEEIGAQHTALLYDRMAEDERIVWDGFAEIVPFAPVRTLLFDLGRIRYRDVASGFPEARRRELAAEARAFDPDPYAGELPTYQRMVTLHALYDIALGFEHSPLLGCT